MYKNISPRETTLKILYEIEKNDAYANIALKKYLKNTDYKAVDRGLTTELVYGIMKFKLTLDFIISQFSTVKKNKLSLWILNILRIGIYQIIYHDRIPDSAACNESVNLAKKYGHYASAKFVNAVLRNVSRNKNNIKFPNKEQNSIEYLKVSYSHPQWMIEDWLKKYGFQFTEELCKANNKVPELCVRVNMLKVTPDELIKQLNENSVKAVQGKYCDEALILKEVGNIDDLDVFQQGLFQVQDESSMLVSKILDPQPDEFIIDVCCAPGGKTTHIAQLMQNKGKVLGWDIHPHKIKLVQTAAKRLGLEIIEANVHDATVEVQVLCGRADRVLVDAPCSGLGIIRRKPDIKWNKAYESLENIVHLQKEILQVSSKYVKPGGYLVYSTCTIQDEENIHIIENFLEKNTHFILENIEKYLPDTLKKESAKQGYIQLFPHIDDIDGFFICKLRRKI
ncbi:MAG: rRNA (cytosine967-C5)-methyltransferase [Clostridiales bacterium]|jgi:16S rRNA (cytosine967-C5)-methyltransferase|nr:rRNA (cytosine967-C5)-methyltransferase [Clostridiales bacterium]